MDDRFRPRAFVKKPFPDLDKEGIHKYYGMVYSKDDLDYRIEDFGITFSYDNYELDPILMQCTGLKDSSGKLIYEGDIVTCNILLGFWVVKFGEFMPVLEHFEELSEIKRLNFFFPTLGFYLENLDPYENNRYSFLCGEMTVKGNIYENPDFLNKELWGIND